MLPNPLHPAVVHFPIVFMFLLPISAGVALWAIRRGANPLKAWAVPVAFAARAVPSSPSGCASRWKATGCSCRAGLRGRRPRWPPDPPHRTQHRSSHMGAPDFANLPHIGEAIKRIHRNESVSYLFD